jgi:hypothetical protein
MAKDALLQTLGVINAGTAGMTTGSTYTSAPLSLEPFGSNGVNNLFMRWMMAQPTYNNLPAATTTSAFQFGFEVSKDGSTWTTAYQSPTDIQSFKTHIVNTFSAGAGGSDFTVSYPTVTSTSTITTGSANITAAPLCSIGDALYFTAAIAPIATATPYYVVSMTPTGTTTATVQVAATPGGTPLVATGTTGTSVATKYLSNQVNYAVNDVIYWTGTAAAGTNVPTAAADTVVPPIVTGGGNIQRFYVISVTSSYTGQVIKISNTLGGSASTTTLAISTGASFFVQPNYAGGEFYAPVGLISGFIDQYGAIQDAYKYVRGWLKLTIPSTIAPIALVRCDLVPSRDGAYS